MEFLLNLMIYNKFNGWHCIKFNVLNFFPVWMLIVYLERCCMHWEQDCVSLGFVEWVSKSKYDPRGEFDLLTGPFSLRLSY